MGLGLGRLVEYARAAGRHPKTTAGGGTPGGIVSQVSRETWDVLDHRDQLLLLAVDDCEAGRFDVPELWRRLYPIDRARIYDDLHLTREDRALADRLLSDATLQAWSRTAESREHFLEWLHARVRPG